MSTNIIEVFRLSFHVGSKAILRDVSLAIREGEWVSIVGPNGAGKTTLLKCLARIHKVGAGQIRIVGKPQEKYGQKDFAREVAYVPQANGPAPPFTTYEFVLMARYPYLRSSFSFLRREDQSAVQEALGMTGTAHLAERGLATLSGGERQKVSIAAALAQRTRILLLDEPATFLDPGHEADIHRLLARINRERNLTVVSVTHDINSAVLMSSRILALKDGRKLFWGCPEELMNNEILQRVYDKPFQFVDHPQTGRRIVVADAP